MSELIIENICNLVIAEGLAENEQDFCERWLCRGEGYMRTLRFRGLQPSADALAVCANKLGLPCQLYVPPFPQRTLCALSYCILRARAWGSL